MKLCSSEMPAFARVNPRPLSQTKRSAQARLLDGVSAERRGPDPETVHLWGFFRGVAHGWGGPLYHALDCSGNTPERGGFRA
jgi:hypothetical protein